MFVKRVVAVGGDFLEIKNLKIYINHVETMKIGSVNYPVDAGSLKKEYSCLVPVGSVFVLGDNIDHSYDSRDFGTIKIRDLKGKVLFVYFSRNLKRVGQKI
jgi:signal peptidase I